MAEAATGAEFSAVPSNDTSRFLAAMLQGMKSKRGGRRRVRRVDNAEYAALFAQLVAILVEERVGEVPKGRFHRVLSALPTDGGPMAMLRPDYKGIGQENGGPNGAIHCAARFVCLNALATDNDRQEPP